MSVNVYLDGVCFIDVLVFNGLEIVMEVIDIEVVGGLC